MRLYWFAFDINKYEGKTSDLTMLQDGAYNRLLRHYYKTRLPIPLDMQKIVILAKAFSTEEIEAVSYVLKRYFREESDGWHQNECDEQLAKVRRVSNIRRRAALKSHIARASANAQHEQGKCTVTNTNNNNINPKPKSVRHFVPPTLEEVSDYCRQRGNAINPQRWLSHYESNGWMVGRSRMRDWRASVRYWETAGEPHGTNQQHSQAGPKPHITAQHQRWVANTRAAAAGAGTTLDSIIGNHRPGSQARLTGASDCVVEGEAKELPE